MTVKTLLRFSPMISAAFLSVIAVRAAAPGNDNFSARIEITGLFNTVTGSNVDATKELGEPSHHGDIGGASVWWTWTAPSNGMVTMDTVGSSFDTLLAVYTGNSVSSLTHVASDDQSGGNSTSSLTFPAAAGTIYQIAVDGYKGGSGSAAKGNIVLSLRGAQPTPVQITWQPASRTAVVGGEAAFRVIATGGTVAFQWRKDGTNLVGSERIFVINYPNASLLRVFPVLDTDAGVYSVVVSNAAGVVTSADAALSIVDVAAWGTPFSQDIVPAGLTNVVSIAAGVVHNLALRADGTVVEWNAFSDGQTNVPAGLTNVVAIAGGGSHSLALRADGTVVAWGANDYGQTTVPAGLTNVVGIAGGWFHSLALRADGTVATWGNNAQGQTDVPPGLTNVVGIVGGPNYSLALRIDGTVVAWGNLSFDVTPAGLSNVAAIAIGERHSLALLADSTVVAWSDSFSPATRVPAGLTNVVAIAASGSPFGEQSSLALLADGTLVAWGDFSIFPPPGLSNVVAIAGGRYDILALIANDGMSVGNSRPLLTSQPVDHIAPVGETVRFQVSGASTRLQGYQWQLNGTNLPNATNFVLVLTNVQTNQAGSYSVMAVDALGTAIRRNVRLTVVPALITTQPQGQTPVLGGSVALTVSVQSTAPLSYQWRLNGTNLPGATNATLALVNLTQAADGRYSVVVSNAYGVVTSTEAVLSVVVVAAWGNSSIGTTRVPAGLTNVVAVAGGYYYSLALRADGTVVAWGTNNNYYGQATVPAGLTNVVAIAAADIHSLALRADGTVVAWGANYYGQATVPAGLTNVVAIAAGDDHSLALRADGTVVAWGDSFGGATNVPAGLTNVVAIAAGDDHSLALRADGVVLAWGSFSVQTNVPLGLANVVAIASGTGHSLALRADGTIVGWGADYDGQATVPTGLSNIVAIAGGGSHSLALRANGTVFTWGNDYYGHTNVPAGLTNVVTISGGEYHSLALVGNGAPFLANALADRFVPIGGTVYFQASSSGARPLAYQWQLNGTNLPSATNAVLALTNVQLAQAGNYSVTLSNSVGTVTGRSARLSVIPILITSQPEDRVALVAESALFSVGVQSSVPVTHQWRFNGLDKPGETNASVTLSNLTLADNGLYAVVARNAYGAVTSAVATLTVWEPLTVSAQGRGLVELEPGPYTFGDIVVIRATPARWAAFSRWSDGTGETPRSVTIGVTNRYTAIFSNLYPMERWTNQFTGQTWEVPAGMPRIYVNGSLTFGGTVEVPDTNAVVGMESSFGGDGFILYTTNGSDPIQSESQYSGEFVLAGPATLRASAVHIFTLEEREADPVSIGFLPTLRGWTRGGGDLAIAPHLAAYTNNAPVTVTATPSNGWVFVRWGGDAFGTNRVLQIAMDRGKTIEAIFGTYVTNGPFGGGGTVSREPTDGPYPFASSVRLTATPQTGRYFVRWLGAAGGLTDNPLYFTVTNANLTNLAQFIGLPTNTFALTVRIEGDGLVSRDPGESWYYTNGTTVWLTNRPAPDQSFAGWSGDTNGTTNPLPLLMNTNKTIVARFVSTVAPVVTLTSPTNHASFGAPANIFLSADASDGDGRVVRVDFMAADSNIAMRTEAPFNAVWTSVAVGSYQLTAVAYDNSGLRATSAPVMVTVNPPARFRFAQTNYLAGESAGWVTLLVTNEGVQGGTVNFATVSGSAQGGYNGAGDFEHRLGALDFNNGQSTGTISIAILDDFFPEQNETFEVRLISPDPGATLGSPAVATVTILDDDAFSVTNSSLAFRFPEDPPAISGRLRVVTIPEEAGGQWRFPWELAWRNSNPFPEAVVSNAPGNYDLELRPKDGWELQSRTLQVTLLAGRTIDVTSEYYRVESSRKGMLTVHLGPNVPEITNNAGWRLVDGSSGRYLRSGETLTNLATGTHLIEFDRVSGWSRPTPRPVEVFEGTSTPPVTENYLLALSLPQNVALPVPLTRARINGGLTEDPQLPFAYCGQLRTDVGSGSGIAVQEGVVLTAAHLVFKDNLSWVTKKDWFFQQHEGEFDPRPLHWRDSLILAGYAAARTGLRPNESSLASRLEDVAALYFWEPAARTGYSGYLTSDPGTTNWLASPSQKMLVGYPVDGASFGYTLVEAGKMHRIESANYQFTQESSSQVYLCNQFLSFPGNSGGPLCVRRETGWTSPPYYIYYPAGVYVGSVSNVGSVASAVRAIDRDVVTLIQQANVSAQSGRNHPSGGVFPFGDPVPDFLKVGYLKVSFEPPCVTNYAATWWVDGYTNSFFPTQSVAAIEYTYTIKFTGIPGFVAPGPQTVSVMDRQTNVIVARHLPISGASLRVSLEPADARWFIDGVTNARASGELHTNLPPCDHTVSFAPPPGFETPAPRTVTLTYGSTNVLTMSLRRLPFMSLTRQEGLRLRGSSGATYQVQFKHALSASGAWSNFPPFILSSESEVIPGTFPIPTNGNGFYRGLLKP